MSEDTAWACDVAVSMPEPLPFSSTEPQVDMGSHVFTRGGLRHNLSPTDLVDNFRPTYAPPEPTG